MPSPFAGFIAQYMADANVYNDAGSTLAANNDTVAQWNNQGGGRPNATSSGTQKPVYKTNILNGLPGILFDTSDDRMIVTTTNLAGPYTIFVVASAIRQDSSVYIFDGSPFDKGGFSHTNESSGRYRLDGTSVIQNLNNGAVPFIYVGQVNGASSYLTVDAGSKATGTVSNSLVSPWQIGGIGSSGFSCGGYVHEILVYSSALSDANADVTREYLRTKWHVYGSFFVPDPYYYLQHVAGVAN